MNLSKSEKKSVQKLSMHKNVKMVKEQKKYGCKTHGDTNLMEDHGTGDMICMKCAVVVEERMISEEAEWRNFADDSQTEKWSKSRTGGSENPFLSSDANLGTIIKLMDKNCKNTFSSNIVQQSKRRSIDNALEHGWKEIEIMGDRISLPSSVLQRAKHLYTELYKHIKLKGNILLVDSKTAACLYIACRLEKCSRSKREIAAIYAVNKTVLAGAINRAYRALGMNDNNFHNGSEMIDRYCSYLEYPKPVLKKSLKIGKQIELLNMKKKMQPEVIAATAIFLAAASSQGTLSGHEHIELRKRFSEEISEVIGITANEILRAAKVKDLLELNNPNIFD